MRRKDIKMPPRIDDDNHVAVVVIELVLDQPKPCLYELPKSLTRTEATRIA
jgi:hypothetical protein